MLTIISFLFVIPFLLWLTIFLTKWHYQKKTGADFKMRLKEMSTVKKIAILSLLLFVISSCFLSSQGFYYSFLKPMGSVVLIGLIVIALCIFVKGMNLGASMIVWTIVFSLPSLGMMLFDVLLMEYSYETLQSPDQQTHLVIEYQDFTLGETNYSYKFYKKIPYLPIIERLDHDTYFYVRGAFHDNLQLLGAHRAEWHDGYVLFNMFTGDKIKVKWKDS